MITMRVTTNTATIASGSSWIVSCELDSHLDNYVPYDAVRIDNRSAKPLTIAVNQSADLTIKQRAKTTIKFVALNSINGVSITNNGSADISAGEIQLSFIKGSPSEIGVLEEGGASTYLVSSTGAVINPATNEPLTDDTVKGLLRSIGDAGTSPANTVGETVLRKLNLVRDAILSPTNAETFTTTPLGSGATYTSSSYDFNIGRLGYATCIGISDQASATNGVNARLSINNTNWDYIGAQTTATGGVGVALSQEVCARYVCFQWQNGSSAQGYFRFGGRFHI